MGDKNYWFKTGTAFTLHGWREGGLVPFGWKGWLFTIAVALLEIGAWQLAVFAGAHHWQRLSTVAWSALPVLALIYMGVACLKSK